MGALLAGAIGVVLGAVLVTAAVWSRRRPVSANAATVEHDAAAGPALCRRLLDLMDPAAIVVATDDSVVLANPAARALGIVRSGRVLVPDLLALARTVRAGGGGRADIRLPGALAGSGPRLVGVQGARLGDVPGAGPVALVLQDVTEVRRMEAVRRDFVSNVGHELKTPVGALALLAEAVEGAAEEPETVRRFARRMSGETDRLAVLIQELIDLSRLQGAEPLPRSAPVDVDQVLAQAVDRTRTAAGAKGIDVAVGPRTGLVVTGVASQLTTAVANLLANAIAYSPEGARVAIAARASSGFGEVTVIDRGIGIPRQSRARVFERFYRVDQSRAASTGGTGLGLAIVKHVAANHGGSISVWSEEGVGSTFTLRIPLDHRTPATDGHSKPSSAMPAKVTNGRP
jgi:two-component system sensor histidine kinase SenX3